MKKCFTVCVMVVVLALTGCSGEPRASSYQPIESTDTNGYAQTEIDIVDSGDSSDSDLTDYLGTLEHAQTASTYIPALSEEVIDPSERYIVVETLDGRAVEADTDYSNIVSYTEKDVYSSDTEDIEFHLKNNNIGKGFWISGSIVQRYEHGEWVTLSCKGTPNGDLGLNFGIALDEEGYVDVRTKIYTDFMGEPFVSGQYRIASRLLDRTVYAYFSVE